MTYKNWLQGLVSTTLLVILLLLGETQKAEAFSTFRTNGIRSSLSNAVRNHRKNRDSNNNARFFAISMKMGDEDEELREVQEESRLKILRGRRKSIRRTLKGAESLRNYRLANDYVPELDEETGKPIKSDSKSAVTVTAAVVAIGAVVLRVGGRAALVSTLGLDFATQNPELKDNLDSVLQYAESMNTVTEALLFVLAWTGVKVFCFDAGGVVLALASGVLFGGVLQGAAASAFAATVGSSVAFALAKLDTPVRKKALELVEQNPSLRGIERVVAEDGIKAILTLRLAPVLPIPIGMYNYVYGVTNVPFLDFAAGIFLGSFKPYLLDSYLGVFGKSLVDGTAATTGQAADLQDIILLVVLGVSVLIGVFASQLASETWETVTEEIENEKRQKEGNNGEEEDPIVRKILGVQLPRFLLQLQKAYIEADARINEMIRVEYKAKVWNQTTTDDTSIAPELDPSQYSNSPEIVGAYSGFDWGGLTMDGIVLTPCLLKAFLKFADPLYNEETDEDLVAEAPTPVISLDIAKSTSSSSSGGTNKAEFSATKPQQPQQKQQSELRIDDNVELPSSSKKEGDDKAGAISIRTKQEALELLGGMLTTAEKRLKELDDKLLSSQNEVLSG